MVWAWCFFSRAAAGNMEQLVRLRWAPTIGCSGWFVMAGSVSLSISGALRFRLASPCGSSFPYTIHGTTLRVAAHLDFMMVFGLGILYGWLTAFPLSRGEQWAWWTWLVSGVLGFATFLAYLGYGYLDTWHGIGTFLMLPVFLLGLVRSRQLVTEPLNPRCLLATAVGCIAGTGSRWVALCSSGCRCGRCERTDHLENWGGRRARGPVHRSIM